jgi:hypothetical protein
LICRDAVKKGVIEIEGTEYTKDPDINKFQPFIPPSIPGLSVSCARSMASVVREKHREKACTRALRIDASAAE